MSPVASINTPEGQIISLFPSGTSLNESNELLIGGCSASELVSTFGTPAVIIDEAALRDRARRYLDGLRSRWPNSEVVWASKSLPLTSVFRTLGEEGLAVDVAGGGELVMALAAGVKPSKILMHGNAKTDHDIEMAVEAGVGTIVIDNFDDIDRLERIVKNEQAVLVRIIPGILPETHLANATGQDDSKFGLSIKSCNRTIEGK